jgi:hypothetical protein
VGVAGTRPLTEANLMIASQIYVLQSDRQPQFFSAPAHWVCVRNRILTIATTEEACQAAYDNG